MAMASATSATAHHPDARPVTASAGVSPGLARGILAAAILAAVAAGLVATGADATSQAVAQAGADLSRLLRAMAALKALMAVAAAGAVLWRLGVPVTLPWLSAYAAGCAAMAAGPGIIWGMAHVGLGAVLLHGGLLATVLLLWRDPALSARLSAIVAARRAALRGAAP
jgi:hypothetical protein